MEDTFDILFAIIAIISGIVGMASKSLKKGQKKTEQKPKTFNWDEVSQELEKRFTEFVHGDEDGEEDTEEPIIPYAPVAEPAAAPVMPIPVPVKVEPTEIETPNPVAAEGKATEGIPCALHADMKPVEAKSSEPLIIERMHKKNSLNPGRLSSEQLRSAFVMSEVLNRPVALRKRAGAR